MDDGVATYRLTNEPAEYTGDAIGVAPRDLSVGNLVWSDNLLGQVLVGVDLKAGMIVGVGVISGTLKPYWPRPLEDGYRQTVISTSDLTPLPVSTLTPEQTTARDTTLSLLVEVPHYGFPEQDYQEAQRIKRHLSIDLHAEVEVSLIIADEEGRDGTKPRVVHVVDGGKDIE